LAVSGRAAAADRLAVPGAFLSRGDLAELGLGRAQVDAVFRRCPVVVFSGDAQAADPRRRGATVPDRH
jgi:hypothetical protein